MRAAVPDLDLPKIPTSPSRAVSGYLSGLVSGLADPTAASATTGVNGEVTEGLRGRPGSEPWRRRKAGVWSDTDEQEGSAGRVAAPARTAGNRNRSSSPHSVGALVVVPRLAVGPHGVHARRAEHELIMAAPARIARLRSRKEEPCPTPDAMTLGEHLGELRRRLIIAIATIAVGAIVCYVLYNRILNFLCGRTARPARSSTELIMCTLPAPTSTSRPPCRDSRSDSTWRLTAGS